MADLCPLQESLLSQSAVMACVDAARGEDKNAQHDELVWIRKFNMMSLYGLLMVSLSIWWLNL